MRLPEFCIKRPVLTLVLNAMILIVGLVSLRLLTVREYPAVSAPDFFIEYSYPNASAEEVEKNVTYVIENVLAGLTGLETLNSETKMGTAEFNLSFKAGSSPDKALADIRDKLQQAKNRLPLDIQEPFLYQQSSNTQPFLYLTLTSDTIPQAALYHDTSLHLKNVLQTIDGISQVQLIGPQYELEIKLDRLKLYKYQISPDQVIDVLEAHNLSYPLGKFHDELTINLDLTKNTPEELGGLILKKTDHALVYLRDVAQINLQGQKKFLVFVNDSPGVILGIVKSNEGNPLVISKKINEMMPQLQAALPENVHLSVSFDFSRSISASIKNVVHSIIEAIFCVGLIIFLFLRNVRAILIPLITIPISLIGGFVFLAAFGYSINLITLLAMVLAVGLVVDDAIVVLENIYRKIEAKEPLSLAAIKGSTEIGFSIIAMTLTLVSVFLPIAFIQGTIGQVFQEFAVTLAGTVLLSGIIALTLTPLMCHRILKPHAHSLWPQFDTYLETLKIIYAQTLTSLVQKTKWIVAASIGMIALGGVLLTFMPYEIAPSEDKDFIGIFIPPIPGKPLEDMIPYLTQARKMLDDLPETREQVAFMGSWGAQTFALFTPLSKRNRTVTELGDILRQHVKSIPSTQANLYIPPTDIPGIKENRQDINTLSYTLMTTSSYVLLDQTYQKLRRICVADKICSGASTNLALNEQGLELNIDEAKMVLFGLTPLKISKAVQAMFHDLQQFDKFTLDGLKYPITITSLDQLDSLSEIYVLNDQNQFIPLSSVATLDPTSNPYSLPHYRQQRSADVHFNLAEGISHQKASKYLDKMIGANLPASITVEESGNMKLRSESQKELMILFGLALIFIYAILAIQFESLTDPLIIICTVPLAATGALLTLWATGTELSIFSQIGLVTLIGLISKHGILLVDFANKLYPETKDYKLAMIRAASLRLRPILMTTGAMFFGALPLVISFDTGYEIRHAIGWTLLGGLGFGTFLTLLVIPIVYIKVKTLRT